MASYYIGGQRLTKDEVMDMLAVDPDNYPKWPRDNNLGLEKLKFFNLVSEPFSDIELKKDYMLEIYFQHISKLKYLSDLHPDKYFKKNGMIKVKPIRKKL